MDSWKQAAWNGAIAGFAGTAAMTLFQLIEMRLKDRKASDAPLKAVEKITGVEVVGRESRERATTAIHWAYGTAWGVARGLLQHAGLSAPAATAAHTALVWGSALVMLPALKLAPPIAAWDPETFATDTAMHMTYGFATGIAYESLERR